MDRAAWVRELGFALDPFQEAALDALDAGQSVLVAAPTGAGKTVVAEYAVATSLDAGRRAFYTTPIKALSNQKYHDLGDRHGAANVGLLTGDNAINGDAPIVVMTTEVLRNMIYEGSTALDALDVVVLDEVHYLRDPYRGPVWEEVIIHAPAHVRLVCLSATVSNADDVAAWLGAVRGPTAWVVEEQRPIALHHLYAIGDRGAEHLHLLPVFAKGRPNPAVSRIAADVPRHKRGRPPETRRPRRLHTPHRIELVDRLAGERLLPAIYFIFSRAGCAEAVDACVAAGVRLTTAEDAARIRSIVAAHVDHLSDDDLVALDYDRFLTGLQAGVAAHHAGMVPPFKEAVEACFVEGLLGVVFATETLALGINMPARSVVIERLVKWDGERRQMLTPADYTQLTGRAGRRGIDDVGHAVVLWSPWVTFDQVAGLAASRSYRLISAFRPTYNMAANLVRRYDPAEAHRLLNQSFAQFQADADIVWIETRLRDLDARRAELWASAACDRGDVEEYAALRRAERARARSAPRTPAATGAVSQLRPGTVIALPGDPGGRPVVVLTVSERKGGTVRITAVTGRGRRVHIGGADLDRGVNVLGRIRLPQPYQPASKAFQRDVIDALRSFAARPEGRHGGRQVGGRSPQARIDHPVAGCPDVAAHLRALKDLRRIDRDRAGLAERVEERSESLARRLDAVLAILARRGYVEDWSLTDRGALLSRLYHEADLLVAEALVAGLFDGLDAASLAALLSCVVYERRGPGEAPRPWFPSADLRRRFDELDALAVELVAEEVDAGLPSTRLPDPGFVAAVFGWAQGEALGGVLFDEDVTGGDFVRTMRQLVDLLRQVSDLAPDPVTGAVARAALAAVDRGVVAASAFA